MWWYVYKFFLASDKLGLISASKFYLLRFLKLRGIYNFHINGFNSDVSVRMGTSDTEVLNQIIISEEFKNFFLKKKGEVFQTIIDAGANVGLSSIYFSMCCPQAQIISIEPEEENFRMMKRNLESLNNCTLFKKALWNNDETLFIKDRGTGNWGFSTTKNELNSTGLKIEAISINSILELCNIEKIDILKIDIEGAEKELFTKGTLAWLDKCHYILVEIHDYINPGASRAVFESLTDYNLNDIIGEYMVFKNRKYK
jgi:FkbM family methyltransferase